MKGLSTLRARVAVTVAVAVLGSTAGATFLAYQLERNSEHDRFVSASDAAAFADLQQATTIAKAESTTANAVTAVRRYIGQRFESGGYGSAAVGFAVVDGSRPRDGDCAVDPGQDELPNTICVAALPTEIADVMLQDSGDGIWIDGGDTYASVHSIDLGQGSHVGLVELYDFGPVRHQLTRLRNDLLLLDGIGMVVAVLLGLAVATGISRPVRRTAGAARRLGDGDLDTRIPVRGSGELAELARNFNAMAQRLSDTLTDLRASQTLQQRFVSDVSHELRTPLAAMVAAGEGLDSADPATRERATVLVRTQTRRMSRMVEHLLEMSRFDAGQATLDLEPVDLGELAQDVVRTVAPDAGVRITAFGDVTVEADARRLHTILRNLVANADQHGAPPIDVVIDARADPVVVTVADDGPGIPDPIVPTIFDRFVRADTARSSAGSTGLGLAIAAENARLHGAALDVSTTGRTAFALHLPRRPVGQAADDTVG